MIRSKFNGKRDVAQKVTKNQPRSMGLTSQPKSLHFNQKLCRGDT